MNKSSQRLSKHATGMIGLLVVQYVLGMISNLYIPLPEHADKNLGFSHGQWVVWAHIILGTLIVLGMISLYVRAVKVKNKTWKIAGGIAGGATILAWTAGDDFFVNQQNGYSLAMSLFFIVALVTLGWGVYKAKVEAKA